MFGRKMRMRLCWMLLLVIGLSGCWWSSGRKLADSERVDPLRVEILRTDLLAKGGAVLVEPFRAGAEAEATPLLDRLSLSIVQGVSDALSEAAGVLRYIKPDSVEAANFIIEGHIDQFQTPGLMDRMLFNKKAVIRIKGDVRDIKTRETVALIYDQREVMNNQQALQKAAYDMGVAIAGELSK